jgi:hypothetical protein
MVVVKRVGEFITILDGMLDGKYDVDLGMVTGAVLVKRSGKLIFKIYHSWSDHKFVLYLKSKEDRRWVKKLAEKLKIEFKEKK